ncbi:aldo/keto reductase [Paenibacillus sp. J2TS4]|uniref:aldo/keto reductase n=1 Tax=Paenibacillus sp. J2TS4 TaxID=2807194 RepID=UPI001B072756|nr:aldo/keto reductase [Paenibacillus sp. J2TS4]GIP34432.1 aldo/keto reductase [Paenibacillus sp. J2TS4]
MRYSLFGKTGYKVSSLGFGAMNLPGVPFEQADKALNYALDHGINYIDTAAAYRNSEEIIGKSIAHRRQEYFLATKTNKRDYDSARQEIEESLNKLQTNTIDLLQIHYVNYEHEFEKAMSEDGAYRAAVEAREAGKIRFIGLTGHRPDLLTQWIESGCFDQVLFHLNLAQPFALEQLIPTMTRLQMGKVAMKPLSGGFIQPVEKAIRYPYSQDVHVTISGMVSVEEVRQNIQAQEKEVSEAERQQLESLAAELGEHNCRRCNYCSCPIGIPIPDVMISSRIRNKFGLLPKGDGFYEKHKEKLFSCADYEPCREQPLCEQKCPYHLPMQSVIQQSVSYFSS